MRFFLLFMMSLLFSVQVEACWKYFKSNCSEACWKCVGSGCCLFSKSSATFPVLRISTKQPDVMTENDDARKPPLGSEMMESNIERRNLSLPTLDIIPLTGGENSLNIPDLEDCLYKTSKEGIDKSLAALTQGVNERNVRGNAIDRLSEELSFSSKHMHFSREYLHDINHSLTAIKEAIACLREGRKTEGVWRSIDDNLEYLTQLIK